MVMRKDYPVGPWHSLTYHSHIVHISVVEQSHCPPVLTSPASSSHLSMCQTQEQLEAYAYASPAHASQCVHTTAGTSHPRVHAHPTLILSSYTLLPMPPGISRHLAASRGISKDLAITRCLIISRRISRGSRLPISRNPPLISPHLAHYLQVDICKVDICRRIPRRVQLGRLETLK